MDLRLAPRLTQHGRRQVHADNLCIGEALRCQQGHIAGAGRNIQQPAARMSASVVKRALAPVLILS